MCFFERRKESVLPKTIYEFVYVPNNCQHIPQIHPDQLRNCLGHNAWLMIFI